MESGRDTRSQTTVRCRLSWGNSSYTGTIQTIDARRVTVDCEGSISKVISQIDSKPITLSIIEGASSAQIDVQYMSAEQTLLTLSIKSMNNEFWALIHGVEQPFDEAVPDKYNTATPALQQRKKSNLAKIINNYGQNLIEDHFPEFLNELGKRLLEDADRQKNDAAQHPYFDALSALKKNAIGIQQQIISVLAASCIKVSEGKSNNFATKSDLENPAHLSLVEKSDFEDWLVVRVTASKAELQNREILIELQLRIDAAFSGKESERIHNPYSPSSICNALHKSTRNLKLSNKIEKLLFTIFLEKVLCGLSSFYKVINKALIDQDILRDINVNKYLAKQVQKTNSADDKTKKIEKKSDSTEANAAKNNELESQAPTSAIKPLSESILSPRSTSINTESAYSTASNLWQVKQNFSEDNKDSLRQIRNTESDKQSVECITEAIHKVKKSVVNGDINLEVPGALKSTLYEATEINSQSFIKDCESADMIESLVNTIIENSRVENSLQAHMRKLQFPLLEILLNDPSVFTAEYHPARQAINYLALLSDKGSVNLNHNKKPIEDCINTIVGSGFGDSSGIQSALDKLEGLVDKEKNYIERNLLRVTEACEGQQKNQMAFDRVEKELNKRFEGKDIPTVIMDLLNSGWKELMRLCYLREGEGSRAWDMTLVVLDQLIYRTTPDFLDEEKLVFKETELIKLINKGLSKVAISEESVSGLQENIKGALNSKNEKVISTISYQAKSLDKKYDNALEEKTLNKWVKRAKGFKEGQWLEYFSKEDPSRLIQLAWISNEFDRYVFVNHHGMKILDVNLHDLSVLLKEGSLIVLSDESLPAVEKGLDTLVQKIYDQLSFDASIDPLTGLKTRKEFERCLAQSVARTKQNESYKVLIFIDILQFKLINNTCGYEVGDLFLKDIADRIRSSVDSNCFTGRIGSNEFGIIATVESEHKGYLLASKLKSEIEEDRFVHSDSSFSITAIVSMIGFDEKNDKIMELLRSVEAAAEICKKSGQKEIQVVHSGDSRMEERDEVMSWVVRINNALDEDRLKLRCQLIAPILDPQNLSPHFEILLTVVDESGEHLPPFEFIRAAEEYSRMGAVDRWVISSILQWMVDNDDFLDEIGGFSINLSGHSINDETFLDFIFEALVRHQVPRDKIIFEITETTAVANLEDAADFINEMRNIGCRFSLDDFGAGQSSYAYLKRLPVDFIKIDGAFVKNIIEDDVDYALVKSITEMGHFLNKKIIAEFVSSKEILDVVRDIGVDYVQGFHLGKPIMISDLEMSLKQVKSAV